MWFSWSNWGSLGKEKRKQCEIKARVCELERASQEVWSCDSRRWWAAGWGPQQGWSPSWAGLFPGVAPSTTLFSPSIVCSCLCIQPHEMHTFSSLLLSFILWTRSCVHSTGSNKYSDANGQHSLPLGPLVLSWQGPPQPSWSLGPLVSCRPRHSDCVSFPSPTFPGLCLSTYDPIFIISVPSPPGVTLHAPSAVQLL